MVEQPLTRRSVDALYDRLRMQAAADAERRHQAVDLRLMHRIAPLGLLPPDLYTWDATAILTHLHHTFGATLTRAQGSLPALALGDLVFQMADFTTDLVRVTGPGGRSVLVDSAAELGSNLDYILHVPPPAAPGSEMDGDDDMPF